MSDSGPPVAGTGGITLMDDLGRDLGYPVKMQLGVVRVNDSATLTRWGLAAQGTFDPLGAGPAMPVEVMRDLLRDPGVP